MLYLYVYITSAVIGSIIWGIRLEGRVSTDDQKVTDLKELLISKLDSIDNRLSRIEKSYNGHLFRD